MTALTLDKDLENVIERARIASAAAGLHVPTEAEARRELLRPVLGQLPAGAREATRVALEARMHPRALAAVSSWRWGSGNLVLLGKTGTGKTSAAAWLVRKLCAQATQCGGEALQRALLIRWQSCRDLSEVGRETKLGTGTPEVVQRCQYARLLVLNDLGIDDDRKTLERVLDARYERGWPTITTTGLRARGVNSLEAALGDALTRRLVECGSDRGTFVDLREDSPRAGHQ